VRAKLPSVSPEAQAATPETLLTLRDMAKATKIPLSTFHGRFHRVGIRPDFVAGSLQLFRPGRVEQVAQTLSYVL